MAFPVEAKQVISTLAFAILVAFSTPASAAQQLIHLKTGGVVRGEILSRKAGVVEVSTSSGVVRLREQDLEEVEELPADYMPPPTPVVTPRLTEEDGITRAEVDSQAQSVKNWRTSGFVGGFLGCGPVGCLGVTGVATISRPTVAPSPDPLNDDYNHAYRRNYVRTLRRRRARAAFLGGTVGTLALVAFSIGFNALSHH